MILAPLPPGPRGRLLTGSLPEFRRDILGFYTHCARTYGDCASFRLGWNRLCLVSHPDLIEKVLVTESRKFAKRTYVLRLLLPVLGNGLLTSEGDFWLRQRRLVQPAFHRQRLSAYAEHMVACSRRLLADWKDGQTRDLHADMMRLTLEIVAKVLFDADVGGDAWDVGEALEVVMTVFLRRWESLLPLPSSWPTPGNLRLRRAVRRLDDVVYRMIKQRRVTGEDRGDLLSILLRARDEDGSQMTDVQVRDEAMTLFLAGHETTANALAWTWYLLGRHPGVEAKLLAELQTVLADREPAPDDTSRLPYTESVVLESLRLYPPAYGFGRLAIEDLEVGGYRVPAGTTVLVSQWVVHRDARFFDNPEEFRPERWADGLAKRLPRFAYFPFGGGPRICIGNTFAMVEAILILATILQRVRVELVPEHPVTPKPVVTLRPAQGIKAVVRRR